MPSVSVGVYSCLSCHAVSADMLAAVDSPADTPGSMGSPALRPAAVRSNTATIKVSFGPSIVPRDFLFAAVLIAARDKTPSPGKKRLHAGGRLRQMNPY